MTEELAARIDMLEQAVLALSARVLEVQMFEEDRDEHGRWTSGGNSYASSDVAHNPDNETHANALDDAFREHTSPAADMAYDSLGVGMNPEDTHSKIDDAVTDGVYSMKAGRDAHAGVDEYVKKRGE